MKRLILFCLLVLTGGCNDLTEPMPDIAGTYLYRAVGPDRASRSGIITIYDDDRRTARFTGDFEYREESGLLTEGKLNGAWMSERRIWFNFLDEPNVYHEAEFLLGFGSGEIFLHRADEYAHSGWSFTLTRAR